MKIFCPVKFLRSIRMSLKLLLRCGVINVSPKVEFNEPNKRFRVEDKFAVLLGELPGDSCLSKVPGHSRRIVSNCSITDCSPLYFSRCLPGRVHHVPGTGSGDSRNITRHHPGLWLAAGGGATDQWQARTRERRALAWSVAAAGTIRAMPGCSRRETVGLQGPWRMVVRAPVVLREMIWVSDQQHQECRDVSNILDHPIES